MAERSGVEAFDDDSPRWCPRYGYRLRRCSAGERQGDLHDRAGPPMGHARDISEAARFRGWARVTLHSRLGSGTPRPRPDTSSHVLGRTPLIESPQRTPALAADGSDARTGGSTSFPVGPQKDKGTRGSPRFLCCPRGWEGFLAPFEASSYCHLHPCLVRSPSRRCRVLAIATSVGCMCTDSTRIHVSTYPRIQSNNLMLKTALKSPKIPVWYWYCNHALRVYW